MPDFSGANNAQVFQDFKFKWTFKREFRIEDKRTGVSDGDIDYDWTLSDLSPGGNEYDSLCMNVCYDELPYDSSWHYVNIVLSRSNIPLGTTYWGSSGQFWYRDATNPPDLAGHGWCFLYGSDYCFKTIKV